MVLLKEIEMVDQTIVKVKKSKVKKKITAYINVKNNRRAYLLK